MGSGQKTPALAIKGCERTLRRARGEADAQSWNERRSNILIWRNLFHTAEAMGTSYLVTRSVSPEPVAERPNLIYSGARTSVTISQPPRQTVEEASINGTLVWVKVTPRYARIT